MRRIGVLFPLALAVAGCGSSVDGPAMSRVTLLLTDAPGDITEAVVTISSVYLQGSPSDDELGGRVYLMTEQVTTNLLALTQDVETLASDVTIAAGEYGQLRFVIDGAYIVVETESGEEVYATPGYEEAPEQVDGTLQCPSCGESGIKVNLTDGLLFDESTETLIVDFDVEQSFGHPAGSMWVMDPLLQTIPQAAAN